MNHLLIIIKEEEVKKSKEEQEQNLDRENTIDHFRKNG
jgi:hypothetical protein